MSIRLLFFTFLLSLTACTSVRFQAPGNRFITSESQGDKFLRGKVHFGAHGGSEIEIINNKFSTTPTANPEITEDSGMQLGLELNVIPRLDFYFLGNQESYNSGGIKFQILGKNLKETKASDFSLSVGLGGLFSSHDYGETNDSNIKVNSETSFGGYEYFLLIGFRPSDKVLLYAGPWLVDFDIDSKLDRTESGVTTRTMNTTGDGKQKSAVFGLQFGKTLVLNLEGAFTKTEYKAKTPFVIQAEDKGYFVWGATLGFAW